MKNYASTSDIFDELLALGPGIRKDSLTCSLGRAGGGFSLALEKTGQAGISTFTGVSYIPRECSQFQAFSALVHEKNFPWQDKI